MQLVELYATTVEIEPKIKFKSFPFARHVFHGGEIIQLEEITQVIELADKKRDKPVIVQVDQWADASILSKVIAKARKSRTKISIATRKPS